MSKKTINEVLADNLAYFMKERGLTQKVLGDKCSMGQTTISLYLNPSRRKISHSGKEPSAKLSEVELLSKSLGIEIWQLLRPLSPEQRAAYESIETAFKALQPKTVTASPEASAAVQANVPPKLKQLLSAKAQAKTSDFADPPPTAVTHLNEPPA